MVRNVVGELFRFGIVGLLSNGLLYIAYLALTSIGVGPKTSMTIAFAAGVLQTYVANRSYTFRAKKGERGAFVRYFATYGLAYILNFLVLMLFVDELGFPHAVIQGVAILGLALVIFLLQKYWVFAAFKESI
jgi:putative flippase GtrA